MRLRNRIAASIAVLATAACGLFAVAPAHAAGETVDVTVPQTCNATSPIVSWAADGTVTFDLSDASITDGARVVIGESTAAAPIWCAKDMTAIVFTDAVAADVDLYVHAFNSSPARSRGRSR